MSLSIFTAVVISTGKWLWGQPKESEGTPWAPETQITYWLSLSLNYTGCVGRQKCRPHCSACLMYLAWPYIDGAKHPGGETLTNHFADSQFDDRSVGWQDLSFTDHFSMCSNAFADNIAIHYHKKMPPFWTCNHSTRLRMSAARQPVMCKTLIIARC